MDDAPEYLAEHLRRRLAEDGRTNALGLDVAVHGREVVVAGSLPTEARRRAVEAVAAETLPGYEILNRVTVEHLAGPAAAEELG